MQSIHAKCFLYRFTTKNKQTCVLLKLLAETASQEKNLEDLRVALAEKEAPLKVAQTRLSTRRQRPNVELCHDPAQTRLMTEVKELANHVERYTWDWFRYNV